MAGRPCVAMDGGRGKGGEAWLAGLMIVGRGGGGRGRPDDCGKGGREKGGGLVDLMMVGS